MIASEGAHRAANARKKTSKSVGKSFSNLFLISWTLILGSFGVIFYRSEWRSSSIFQVESVDGVLENSAVDGEQRKSSTRLNALSDKVSRPVQDGLDQDSPAGKFEKSDVHVVFSTDCSAFQDWQSLLVFHSAGQAGQKGSITRIASGCDDEQKLKLTTLYKIMHPNYHVHFTPNFDSTMKSKSKCKPLRQW